MMSQVTSTSTRGHLFVEGGLSSKRENFHDMGIINPLPLSVVNRIAAGEVVVRPANAVKELIENSLDAGATEIVVTIKQGGLELLQVQDNGKGFLKEDLELACVRFATSKLHEFEDLQQMQTYGFRGEALASISLVSKVTITSRTEGLQCAYQAKYDGCKMVICKPSAGNQGTCITAENIFYDAPSRRQSLKQHEEASKVEDIIIKYAIHRPDISFALRGAGTVFRTKGDDNRQTVLSNLIGPEIAQNLIDLNYSSNSLKYKLSGCISEPISISTAAGDLSKKTKRKSFFVFINGRAVICNAIRLAVETLLAEKDLITSFVLISLELEPRRIDVNAHPTKESVIFLEEEAIIDDITQYIRLLLPSAVNQQPTQPALSQSFNFELFPISQSSQSPISDKDIRTDASNSPSERRKIECHKQIRTDPLERRLHAFSTDSPMRTGSEIEMVQISRRESLCSNNEEEETGQEIQLESVDNLKREICQGAAQSLRELFKEHIFVGCVDAERLLFQHGTGLYAINFKTVSEEFFYQTVIFGFGNLGCFKLEESISIEEILNLSLGDEGENNGRIIEILADNAEMLHDYFSLTIKWLQTEEGPSLHLLCIPSLVEGFLPQLEGLPQLFKDIYDAPWHEGEENSLRAISHAIAKFFCLKNEFCDNRYVSGLSESAEWMLLIRDHLLPRLQQRLIPQEKFKDSETVIRVVDQHDLYNVFERC